MKIVTIDTLIEINKTTIEKLESLKKNLYLLLNSDDDIVIEDYIHANILIKNAKKIIEDLEEKKIIEETENAVQK